MIHYYSKTTKGFYSDAVHGANIPSDCVEITEAYKQELMNAQSIDKEIVPDENGYPIAVQRKHNKTWDEIKRFRNKLLINSDWSIFPDATPKPSKEAWLTYRQALRDIPQTFSTPEEVVFPSKPE